MNKAHMLSTTPCSRCGGYLRYKSTRNCVPCNKEAASAYNKARREAAHANVIKSDDTINRLLRWPKPNN